MFIYALKFREKGEKEYKSVLITAKDHTELKVKFDEFTENEYFDIDKRTVSWAGGSIPFAKVGEPIVIYANLDELC